MNPRSFARLAVVVLATVVAAACATTSSPTLAPAATRSFEEKMRWILQLEDERQLRTPGAEVAAPAPTPARGRGTPAVQAPPAQPDLVVLLKDPEARIRRRAALAAGRVRLPDAIDPLRPVLQSDPEPEVRQMAAFALGLIGDARAADALTAALSDPDPLVHGRAAEALGLLGHKPAAPAVGAMMKTHLSAGALAGIEPDDLGFPKPAPTEALRLGMYALVRLSAYDELAATLLDTSGRPVSRWWPVAFAFQRIADPRGATALRAMLDGPGQMTRAFGARGLGVIKDRNATTALVKTAGTTGEELSVRVQAVRALAATGDPAAGPALVKLLVQPPAPPPARRGPSAPVAPSPVVDRHLQLEVVTAVGELRAGEGLDLLLDMVSDRWPAMRAAALQSLARVDQDAFLTTISGLDPDPDWNVRAAVARAFGTLDAERAESRLTLLASDSDQRVVAAAIDALVAVKAPAAQTLLIDKLKSDDFGVRRAAAHGLRALKPAGAADALVAALADSEERDSTYVARAAILEALVAIDPAKARPAVTRALGDKDWAIRLKAVELSRTLDPDQLAAPKRPAPPSPVPEMNLLDALIAPGVSTVAYIDTEEGVIEVELAVLDAPRTVANFTALAAKGFFNGTPIHRVVPDFVVQDGDPRGDGDGGPGYTIRDEINQRPYLRGTVGMALDWADTGGSQFFITHSPQPHLDGRYSVFGHVRAGMDVVDRLTKGAVIRSVRVWNGVGWSGR